MKTLLNLTLIILFFTSPLHSQIETNWWYFGSNAGLDFTTGVPVPAAGGAVVTSEGSSSVSDPLTGNLLFYSDGSTVYDITHSPMPNGTGLLGASSSTQSCLIVPQPGSATLFYVFSSSELYVSTGVYYSVVDMTLNGGLGDVTAVKNVNLYTTSNSEQLAATKHANCIDWWIMTKELNNNVHHAFLLTATGISPAVTSTLGLSTGSLSYGQGKFTPDGTKYAIAGGWEANVQLFDFDNTTGVLSNNLTLLSSTTEDVYGLSFSGDNTKLYFFKGTSATDLYQYDVSSGVPATILASGTYIATTSYYNQMQLAKDFKIYIANSSGGQLSVINNPNLAGAACGFSLESVAYSGTSTLGMCNFPDSYFNETSPCTVVLTAFAFNSPISCNGDTDANAWVNVSSGISPYTYSWFPGGSTNDTIFNLGPGTYIVTVTDSAGSIAIDSVVITQPNVLTVDIVAAEDTVCAGTPMDLSLLVNGGTSPYSYQWTTGVNDTLSTNTTTLASSGYVGVTVTDDHNCTAVDSMFITILPIPIISSSPDTCICNGASATITASGTPAYNWSTGATTASITVSPTSSTLYTVSYSNGICSTIDSTFICVYPTPTVSITANDSVCAGTSVLFTANILGGTSPFTYDWTGLITGTTATITATPLTSGTINLTVDDDNGCSATASTSLTVLTVPDITSTNDTCICFGQSITLNASGTPSFVWNTGETTANITVTPVVTSTYIVSYTNGICADDDTTVVCVNPTPIVIASADTSIEYGTSVFLLATGTGPFDWSPSNSLSCTPCSNPEATPENTTTYIVSTTNAFGCTAQDQVTVDIYYVLIIPNVFTPNGDGLNEAFYVQGLPPDSKLTIFNRWGNQLYLVDSYKNDWTTDTDGVYYYVLNTPDGKFFNGFFHVTGN